jgi:hypothetical protein
MKFTIDTDNKAIILANDQKFSSVKEIAEWAEEHNLSHYGIYGISEIAGKIRPEVMEEFTERWKKIMEENKGKEYRWQPTKEINGYPAIIPITPDELKPPFRVGDEPHWKDPYFRTQDFITTGTPVFNHPFSTCETKTEFDPEDFKDQQEEQD